MNVILGLSCFGHDSAAALVNAADRQILWAIADERLSGRKNQAHFPTGAVQAAVVYAKVQGWVIIKIGINYQPEKFLTGLLLRTLSSQLGPRLEEIGGALVRLFPYADYFEKRNSWSYDALNKVLSTLPLQERERAESSIGFYFNWAVKNRYIRDWVKLEFPEIPLVEVHHHTAHAASAYFNSGYNKALIVTVDGSGEDDTHALFLAEQGRLTLIDRTFWPHSLGNLYLELTHHLGFHLGDEYKVMGMAAYGNPQWLEEMKQDVRFSDSGCFEFLGGNWFQVSEHPVLKGYEYLTLSAVIKDRVKTPKTFRNFAQDHFDLAASIQKLTEWMGVEIVSRAIKKTGERNVAMAGGVCLNGLMNRSIRLQSECNDLYIFPGSGDDGTAIGAAQWVVQEVPIRPKRLQAVFFGPPRENEEIEQALQTLQIRYERQNNINGKIAEALTNEKIIAIFRGRSEFGPRSLGNRSIIANPSRVEMKDVVNRRIKHREAFRPFAPACLNDFANEYFEVEEELPFMIQIVQVKPGTAARIPAVVHADGTARVQTVTRDGNPKFYELIHEFYKLTKIPVVLNTSFNLNGEPIVETPEDAIRSFLKMDIDYLAIGDFWVSREDCHSQIGEQNDADFLQQRVLRFKASNDHPLRDMDLDIWPFIRK